MRAGSVASGEAGGQRPDRKTAKRIVIIFAALGLLSLVLLPVSPVLSLALLFVVEAVFVFLYLRLARMKSGALEGTR